MILAITAAPPQSSVTLTAEGPASPSRLTLPRRMFSALMFRGSLRGQHHVARADHDAGRGAGRPDEARHVNFARGAGQPRHAEALVMCGNRHVDDGARFVALSGGDEVQPLGNDGSGAKGAEAAFGENGHIARQPHHLGHRMAHIDDGNPDLVPQPFQIGHDLVLAALVERCERLVHQQQPGRGQQGPPDRHALLLAARKPPGRRFEQMPDAEQVQDLVAARRSVRPWA